MRPGAVIAGLILLVVVVALAAAQNKVPTGAATPTDTPTDNPTPAATATPWPNGWDTAVCLAILHLQSSNDHIVTATQDGVQYDFEGAAKEATSAQDDAASATNDLSQAPTWAPGAQLVSALGAVATHARKSANLLKLGVQQQDPSLISEAVNEANALNASLDAAIAARGSISGLSCPF